MARFLLLLTLVGMCQATSKDKVFQHDVEEREGESGELFQLHSKGMLADIIDLDTIPEVKRVACAGDRLLVLMTDTAPALSWQVDQVVLGGPDWGCNVTRHRPQASSIYVKIASVHFPLEGQVTVHHVPAGPFDMLEEAEIHFHYEPGHDKKEPKASAHPRPSQSSSQAAEDGDDPSYNSHLRFRRGLSNMVSNILNNIDWHANFTATIPFNIGDSDGSGNVTSSDLDSNGTDPMTLALYKSRGQKKMAVTRGQDVKKVKDEFVLNLSKLNGASDLSYTFDLVIKNIDGQPQIVQYTNQFDVLTSLEADATVSFKQELGLTYDMTLDQSPTLELFRVPVAKANTALPPVYLVVSYNALTSASLSAYSAGKAYVRTGYNATGFLTASQRYDPLNKTGSDVTSRDWSIEPWEQTLQSPHRTHVDFSIFQKLTFTSAISWHNKDVDIELSPPVAITIRPVVRLRSSTPDVSRCVNSELAVTSHVSASRAHFTAKAFGLNLWDVALQPALNRDLDLIEGHLGQGCDARCHGPSHVASEDLNRTQVVTLFGRQDPQFESLRAFSGEQIMFKDSVEGAYWCGRPGMPCYHCTQHAIDTQTSRACAARLMTSRAVQALTLLSDYVTVEWKNMTLKVLGAWDEPTSRRLKGQYDARSLHKAGRALTLTLHNNLDPEDDHDPVTLTRLGQLAVCAGFDSVDRASEGKLEVEVAEDGWREREEEKEESREMFWKSMEEMVVTELSPKCSSAPHLSVGDRWPQNVRTADLRCGPVEHPLHRGDRAHMERLIQWNLTSSLTFDPEGQDSQWCGHPSRPCVAQCASPSDDLEPWNWCSTRMMTPRLAIRLRKLQKLAEEKAIGIRVIQAFTEPTEKKNDSASLYHEGRSVRLTSTPGGRVAELASLAVCAGFDFVAFTDPLFVELSVKAQHGFQAVLTSYIEGPARPAVEPAGIDDAEFRYPDSLSGESVVPLLLDGGFPPDTPLSEHVTLRDVMSAHRRYFRLDPNLLECLELAQEDFSGVIEILPDSLYRTRSVNMRNNLDLRHPQERWRFQAGQAVQIRPKGSTTPERLLSLATSILRECPALVRLQMRAVGLGCHNDHLYVDLRPLVPGHERVYVMAWEAEHTEYCDDVMKLQKDMVEGGPVVQAVSAIACKDRGLDPELQFLSFQMGQQGHCEVEGQAEFCRDSRQAREKAADSLQKLLTSAAGQGRLPRYELLGHIRACLVDVCGGCPGVGPVFDQKVRACSGLVHKYVEKAAAAFPDLRNVTAFFNTDTELSTVQALACQEGHVCLEDTPAYSLLVPTVTARYYPNPKKSLERGIFSADVNPTPLLELVGQELAFRAEGKVKVYVEAEKDIYALRNVLKVLMVYNKNVSHVEFHVAPGLDVDLVTSSIQRKLEAWSGVACPRASRFALTPFTIVAMETERHRRSAERSVGRNRMKSRVYSWEQEWLNTLM